MKSFHKTSFGSTILFIVLLIVNYTTSSSIGDLSQIFSLIHMPPGYVFGIAWGLVYVGLTIALGSRWSLRVGRNSTRKQIHYLFWISCILNATWVLLTVYQQYVMSVSVLFALRYILYVILSYIRKNSHKIHLQYQTLLPFSLYFGWLTVASYMLGLSQIVFLGVGESIANSIVWVIISVAFATIATCRGIYKTTPWVGILPVFALIAVSLNLGATYGTLATLTSIAALIILGFMWLRRVDFYIK